MTNGTSQGLFVIVAVVIFGIFVTISYVLFQDKMSTGLSSIFESSFETVNLANDFSGDKQGEDEYAIWGFSQLTGDNEGFHMKYYQDKKTNYVYVVGVFEKVGNEYIQDDNGAKLTGHLELPDTIDGNKVMGIGVNWTDKIGNWTFSQSNITSVKLPKHITSIPLGMFDGASKLEEIVGGIPSNVKSIERQSFTNAPLKGTIDLPKGLVSIGDDAFNKSEFTGKLTLGKELKQIGSRAFINANFDEVVDNSKVKTIPRDVIKMSGADEQGNMRFYTK